MLVKMKHEAFQQSGISWKVIEPIITQIKGKNMQVKTEMYKQLTPGQRAVFLFYTYHNHIRSAAEFYWYAAYNIGDIKAWPALKRDILLFDNKDMVSLYEEIEQIVEMRNRLPDGTWREALIADLDQDENLFNSVNEIYKSYNDIAPPFIAGMEAYILLHPVEFVEFES